MSPILTAADARKLGLSSCAVRWRIEDGRWQQVFPRVYCTYTGPLTELDWCRAALRYAGHGAMLSHETAAALHGLAGARLLPVHVTIPEERRVRAQAGLRVHRGRGALDSYRTVRRGLAVQRVERALLDLARSRPARAAAVLAAGVQERLTTAERLRACLLSLPPTVAGRAVLFRVLDDVEGGSRSWLEARCLAVLREAGLPEAVRNHELRLPGRRAWLDLCYPEQRVAIEVDGRGFHVWADAWQHDLARQNDVVLAGWLVLRFTGGDVRHRPAYVVAQVRAALTLRGAA